jgi:hypothetical protein
MPRLDPDSKRTYAARDWGAPARLSLGERVRQPLELKVQIGVDLYEAAMALCGGEAGEASRRADLATHERVHAMLLKAGHVGAR